MENVWAAPMCQNRFSQAKLARRYAMRKSRTFILAVSTALAVISSSALAQGGQHMKGEHNQGMMDGDDHGQGMMGKNGQGMMGGEEHGQGMMSGDDHGQHMMGNDDGPKGQDSQ
jgi:hypothetical protein